MRIRVQLRLLGGTATAEQIDETVGMRADRQWRAGELRKPGTLLRHEMHGWELGTAYVETIDIQVAATPLLTRLAPAAERLSDACERFGLTAELSFHIDRDQTESQPILHLDRETIILLARLGAEVDVDLT